MFCRFRSSLLGLVKNSPFKRLKSSQPLFISRGFLHFLMLFHIFIPGICVIIKHCYAVVSVLLHNVIIIKLFALYSSKDQTDASLRVLTCSYEKGMTLHLTTFWFLLFGILMLLENFFSMVSRVILDMACSLYSFLLYCSQLFMASYSKTVVRMIP